MYRHFTCYANFEGESPTMELSFDNTVQIYKFLGRKFLVLGEEYVSAVYGPNWRVPAMVK